MREVPKVLCDFCHNEFEIKFEYCKIKMGIKIYEVTYIKCPECNSTFVFCIDNEFTSAYKKRLKSLRPDNILLKEYEAIRNLVRYFNINVYEIESYKLKEV